MGPCFEMGEVPTLPFFPKEGAEQKKYLGFRESLEEQVQHWLHSHEEKGCNSPLKPMPLQILHGHGDNTANSLQLTSKRINGFHKRVNRF
ncbi:hypothetical protein WN943_029114 [Citrus x changshan-huyou]